MTEPTSFAPQLLREGLRAAAVLNACSIGVAVTLLGIGRFPLLVVVLWTVGLLTSLLIYFVVFIRPSSKGKLTYGAIRKAYWSLVVTSSLPGVHLLAGWVYLGTVYAR